MICPQCKGEGTLTLRVPNQLGFGAPDKFKVPCGKCGAYFRAILGKVKDQITSNPEINDEMRKHIQIAWQCLRVNFQSIPDDVVDFIRDAALEALEKK